MNWVRKLLFALRLTREPRYPDAQRGGPSQRRTQAGVVVNPETALCVSAVWACVRYLTQTVAVLPWHVMRMTGERGNEMAPKHPVDWILWKRPSPEWSSFQFRESLLHWALRYGNGYAEIERDTLGRPLALHPLHPDRVTPARDEENGGLVYRVNNGADGISVVEARNMFHLRGFGDGPVGVSVMAFAAESIGWARAAQLFGAAFFGNGMHGDLVITSKKALKPEGLKELEERYEARRKPLRWWRRPFFLDNDMEIKSTGVDPEKGQFVATNQHLVEEICRWFGVPPHKIAHLLRATNNNIEHQSIEVVQDSILPWVKRFEEEADYKLFGPQNRLGFYTKINLLGLLRGDAKSQAEAFRIYREMGVLNANEIRDRLDMNPQEGEGGEKYTMQSQYTTLERIGEAPAEPVAPPAANDDEGGDGMDREDEDMAGDMDDEDQMTAAELSIILPEVTHAP